VSSEQQAPPASGDDTAAAHAPPMRALLRYFLGLGTWGFGGPIATVGYMQRDLVEGRAWMDRDTFLDGVALGQTMPGPLAAQVAMWVGYVRRGAAGALAVAAAFIAPSFVAVLAIAAAYRHYEGLQVVTWLFHGVAPVVIAIITLAAYKLARLTDRTDPRLWTISAAVGVVTAVTGSEIAPLFIGCGLLMVLIEAPPRLIDVRRLLRRRPGSDRGPAAIVPLAVLFATPRRATGWLVLTAAGGLLTSLFLFFLVTGATVFGSGLAVLPVLRAGIVDQHHWLTDRQLLDGLSVGLLTPGPVVIAATFLGYQIAGLPGAAVATLGIFTPIYAGVVVPGRWFVRHRQHPQVQAFVRGATAAAAGAIAGAVVVLGRQVITGWASGVLAAVGLLLLIRFKVKEPILVAAGAGIGLAFLH
jgi:chromate transporter